MRLSTKTFAAMLIGLALTAYQFDSVAQSRGNSRSSSTSRSASRSSSTSGTSRSSSTSRASRSTSTSASRSTSSSVSRPKSSGSTSYTRSTPDRNKQATRPSSTTTTGRPGGTPATRPSDSGKVRPDSNPASRNPITPPAHNSDSPRPGSKPDFKSGHQHKPVHVHRPQRDRVHPRDRDFMHYKKPTYHWAPSHHYYGYRVKTLPLRVRRHVFGGLVYYFYDDIWYRPYNGYYVISRPPYGYSLTARVVRDIAWTTVRLSYYNTIVNTYNQINQNNQQIAQQNEIIARNNSIIASQNSAIAQTQPIAYAASSLANSLGLTQSYGAAGTDYYYQDGVFYSQAPDGQYYVIVPPAGALVERLPEDFDIITLSGERYYQVDNTVYRMVINEGQPYFEVLGQKN